MRCVILQYTKQHAECIGIAVEYLIEKYGTKHIDVLLNEKDYLGKGWFDFFKQNYEDVSLNHVLVISEIYDVSFFLSSSDYSLCKNVFGNCVGLVHQNDKQIVDGQFQNLCICPFICCKKIPFTFRFDNGHKRKHGFYPEIGFFVTGWQEHLNLHILNLLLVKLDLKCLYISKRYEIHEAHSNLIFCERIDTEFIIECFLYKTCILVPKKDSTYFSERISGCIHLCASFGTRLLVPYELKQIYSGFDNFIPYNTIFD
jgi:hypothetical protein